MNLEIKSNDLKNDLRYKLFKDIQNITYKDLNMIKDIRLNKMNSHNESTDCIIEDLIAFKNLSNCSLYKFKIAEKDITVLNQLKNLKYIYFDFCEFDIRKFELNKNISTLCFNMCKNISAEMLEGILAKRLNIIGDRLDKRIFNIALLRDTSNLEILEIHNYHISNILKILEIAPNLKELNITGSEVDNISDFSKLREKVNLTIGEKFFLTGLDESIAERRVI